MEDIALLENALKQEVLEKSFLQKELDSKTREIKQLKSLLENKHPIEILEEQNRMYENPMAIRFASLISSLNSAILVEDGNGKIVFANLEFCKLFQISASPDQLRGKDCSDAAEQSKSLFRDPEKLISRIAEILSQRKKVLGDHLQMKDGRMMKRDFIPVFNNEEYIGHLWNYEDITDSATISKTVESISRFAKESPNPIMRCSADGSILYANTAAKPFVSALSTYKYNRGYVKSKDSINANLNLAYHSREMIKSDTVIGTRIYETVYVPIENENYINIYATDITDNKNAENKIYLLKELLDQLDEFIQVIDKDGNFIFANAASTDRFGLSAQQLATTNIKDLVTAFYNGMAWDEQFSFLKEKGKFVMESTHVRSDNSTYAIEANVRHIEKNGNEYIISFSRDITKRKESEKALDKQRKFYEDILNNIPSDVAVFNTNHEYLFVNPKGIKDEDIRKWIIGKTDTDYCVYRGKAISLAAERIRLHKQVLETKKPLEWEDAIINSNGEAIYNLRKFQPVMGEDDEVKFVIGYGLDITDIKNVQDKLTKSEELYRLVIDATNDGIWDWYIETGYVYLSERWKIMLGYANDELEDHIRSWEKTMHPEDLAVAQKILAEHLELGTPFTYTLRYFKKDGSICWVMCRGFAIRDKNNVAYRMVGSCTDITDVKIAEGKLKESEEKLQAIFNLSYDAQFLLDPDTSLILDCNQRAVELFEAPNKHALIGTHSNTFRKEKITEEETQSIWNELLLKGHWSREVLYATNKGNVFWGSTVAKTIQFNNKKIGFARITDINERKKIEQELIQAKQVAEESTKVKEVFLANMSHEIRTPMNGIIGITDLLYKTTLDGKQVKYLNLIKQSADNLLVIINDILDVSKIESGKLTLEKIPFDISEVLKNAMQSLVYRAEEKGIELVKMPIQTEQNIVIGDPLRLTQILLNLVNNAIKFTDHGYVQVSGRTPHETEEEITFEFTVRDTGIGIPKDKLEFIFEGFTQASSDTARKYGGTGLGLTICKNLIHMQGGNIWIDSELGHGSSFIFSITYLKGSLEGQVNFSAEVEFEKFTETKILLAEDNEINQFLAKTLLMDWGCEVDIANDGNEALALFEINDYHLILMDVQMPIMGGIEATEIIRKHPNKLKAKVPIIALTANALVGDEKKYIAAGMSAYLSKPYDNDKLYLKIKQHLSGNAVYDLPAPPQQPFSASNSSSLPDYEYLRKNFHHNQDFLKKILTIFIETTPAMVEGLNESLANQDYDRMHAVAHKLKTSIDSFKIKDLQETIRAIESKAATRNGLSSIPELIEKITTSLKIVNEDIKRVLQI